MGGYLMRGIEYTAYKQDMEKVRNTRLYLKYKKYFGEDYAKGFIKGLTEGKMGVNVDIAKKLKLNGFSIEDIQYVVDLSYEEISCF